MGLQTSDPGCAGSHMIDFRPLKPGERVVTQIALTRNVRFYGIFDFSLPGDYEIQLSRWDVDNPKSAFIKSNKIKVKVVPANSILG
jgi:hypothetical protein